MVGISTVVERSTGTNSVATTGTADGPDARRGPANEELVLLLPREC